MTRKLREQLVTPPGGWRYEQPETGVVMHGASLNELCRTVATHRINNKLPSGTEFADINEFLCGMPGADCFDTEAGADLPPVTVDGVLKALGALAGGSTDAKTAGERAAACLACPMRTIIKGCFGCRNILPKITEHLLGKQTFGLEKQGCKICGCSLAAKVWYAGQPDNLEYPPNCWVPRAHAS